MASHIALQIGLIAGYLLLLYVFFWFSCGLRRVGTFYLVMDGSAPGITSLSRYAANSDLPRDLPDDTEVGFMVFGSGRGGEVGCQDQLQVVPPAPSDAAWPAIKTQLEDGSFNRALSGPAGLQEALEHAIGNELRDRDGIQQIQVVLTELDGRCAVLDREVLETLADESGVRYSLNVIVAENQGAPMPEEQFVLLDEFARGNARRIPVEALPLALPASVHPPYGAYGARVITDGP